MNHDWYQPLVPFLDSVSYNTPIKIVDDLLEDVLYFKGSVSEFYNQKNELGETEWDNKWNGFVISVASIENGILLIRALS